MFGTLQKELIEHAVYPAMERIRGNRIRAGFRALKATEAATEEQLRDLQRHRLAALLRTCVRSVPAYQNLGITEADIDADPFHALASIPILRKADVRANPGAYVNTAFDPQRFIPNTTGGSTGEPLRFYMDRTAAESYESARFRGLSWFDGGGQTDFIRQPQCDGLGKSH